jgi:3-oxosteroid 1-dehydrogenase
VADDNLKNQQRAAHGDKPRVSRRDFLRLAGVAAAAGATSPAMGLGTAVAAVNETFDHEVDVAVVGSGAAGAVAAIFAHEAGAKTVLVEKAFLFGGTTAKSGGVYWIPNNSFLRERGVTEPRENMLALMARYSYPHLFNTQAERLGLPENEYQLLVALYDNGPTVVEKLAAIGALISMPADQPFGAMPDYFDPETSDAEPTDRRLWPRKPDGSFGLGGEMVRQLKEALVAREVPLLMGHRATKLLQNSDGAVVGLECTKIDGTVVRIRARRGVIFGSGGFTHNKEMMLHFQPGPNYGGCAVPTNEGDFVPMATAAGAKLGHMHSAWRAQIVFEQAVQFSSTPDDVFLPPGDSMMLVNKYGRRVINECVNYNERTKVHFIWDAMKHEWPNQLLMMVYDKRTAELFGGRFPLPPTGTTAPYVIKGDDLPGLATAIKERIAKLAAHTGIFGLDDTFADNLGATIDRYNGFARRGVDDDFGRGSKRYDRLWHSRVWSYPNQGTEHSLDRANPTMHPLAENGPYYAILLAPGTLDTNGGPITNPQAQVLDNGGAAIPGLYGSGNCVSSPTGSYYYAGGGTLGPAITFGYLAGLGAAAEPEKKLG